MDMKIFRLENYAVMFKNEISMKINTFGNRLKS